MLRKGLSVSVLAILALFSAHWAFTYPIDRSADVERASILAAAETATEPSAGSTAANTYCKNQLGKVQDITKIECTDTEKAAGETIKGHCTTSGGCKAEKICGEDGACKTIPQTTGQPSSASVQPVQLSPTQQVPPANNSTLPNSDTLNCALGYGDCTAPAASTQQPPASTETNQQKTLDDLVREIEQKRTDLNNNDPVIQQAAQNYFASQSRLGEEKYVGVESDKPDNTLGGAIQNDVRSAVAQNTFSAISSTFREAGPNYVTSAEQNGLVTRVGDNTTGDQTYYSNITGQAFMQTNGNSLSLMAADGGIYPVEAGSSWQNQLGTMDKAEYNAFTERYFSQTGSPVDTFRYSPPNDTYPNGSVTVTDTFGDKTVISADDYKAVFNAGKSVYGTDQLAREINDWTQGKITVTPPGDFPDPSDRFFNNPFGGIPGNSVSPLSLEQYTDNVQKMFDVYKQLPPELWANAPMNPTTQYNFARTYTGDLGGLATFGGGNLWVNPNDTSSGSFYVTAGHELGHNLSNVFPTSYEWGSNVYGSSWVDAYGGGLSQGALADKFGSDRPQGFTSIYGFSSNPREDQGEVFGAMLANYPAVQAAAVNDPILAQKVQMVQDSFFKTSNGVMDQNYWNNLRVLDSNFTIRPVNPTFLQRVFEALGRR